MTHNKKFIDPYLLVIVLQDTLRLYTIYRVNIRRKTSISRIEYYCLILNPPQPPNFGRKNS